MAINFSVIHVSVGGGERSNGALEDSFFVGIASDSDRDGGLGAERCLAR